MTRNGFGALILSLFLAAGPADAPAQPAPTIPLAAPNAALPEGFTIVRSVRELSDGRLLITVRVENRLAVVDWQAGTVTDIARVGTGPGEYRTADWLYALQGDTTLLTEGGRRWHVLHGTSFVRSIPAFEGFTDRFGPMLSGTDSTGRVLDVVGYRWDPSVMVRMGPYQADSLVVLLASGPIVQGASLHVDTIARIGGRGLEGACSPAVRATRRGAPPPPAPPPCNRYFAAAEQLLLFPDGWVAIARKRPYRVDWRDPDGRWIRGAPLPMTPVSMTDRDRCAALRGFPFADVEPCARQQLDGVAWPDALPPFVEVGRSNSGPYTPVLFAAPDGHLLIRRTPNAASPGTRYDLVDRRGELLGVITLPANEAIVGFGRNSVYTVRTDESDLQWLRRHAWPIHEH